MIPAAAGHPAVPTRPAPRIASGQGGRPRSVVPV